MRGKVAEAERHLADLEPVLRAEGSPSERIVLAGWEGFVDAWYRKAGARSAAKMEQSLRGLDLDTVPVPDRHDEWRAYVYALAGKPGRARADRGGPWQSVGRDRAQRGADAGGGRGQPGRRRQRRRHQTPPPLGGRAFLPDLYSPDLAIAYDRAGQRDSAVANYERYVDTPWAERWSSDGEFTGYALRRIAELSEQAGDSARASRAYSRFLHLWENADPELQPEVRRARDRLAALSAPGSSQR